MAKPNSKSKKFPKKNKTPRVKLHKSFKRSYREDYVRPLEVPGIMAHLAETFKVLVKNWKIFAIFISLVVVCNIMFVGLMDEGVYVNFQDTLDITAEENGLKVGQVAKAGLLLISTIATGGLSTTMSETQMVFGVILFLIMWLVTIYLLRHFFAGHKLKLRDALYNAGSPIVSTFVVFLYAILDCVPIFIFIVVYSSAVTTDFLSTPFYALVFFIFSALMFLISGYLLSSTLIALVSVTVPGLYPMKAMHTASDLMAGRRIKFIIRLFALIIALALMWAIVMLPLILFDLWMKTFEWAAGIPFIPFCLLIMTCFTVIYGTSYLYIYYRWMLDYEEK